MNNPNRVLPQSVFNNQHTVILQAVQQRVIPKLREAQRDALLALKDQFDDPDRANIALIQMPTGCGKSGIAALAPFVCNSTHVLVITPSVQVAKQMYANFTAEVDVENGPPFLQRVDTTRENFNAFYNPTSVRIDRSRQMIDNNLAANPNISLVVTNRAKIGNENGNVQVDDIPADGFDMVIVDEAHHYPATTWRSLIDHFQNSCRVFLTATAEYNGEYILGPQTGNNPAIPPCYRMTREDAENQGIIRRLNFSEVGQPDDNAEQVQSTLVNAVQEQLDLHDQQDPSVQHQGLILAQSIDSLNSANDIFNTYENSAPGVASIFVGNTDDRVLTEFRNGNIRVLIVVGRLLEGFDHKPVSVCAIYRNVARESKVLFSQFVGRAVRKINTEPEDFSAEVISHVKFQQRTNFDNMDQINDVPPREVQLE